MNSSERQRTLNSFIIIEDNLFNLNEFQPVIAKNVSPKKGTKYKINFFSSKKNSLKPTRNYSNSIANNSSKNHYRYLVKREKKVLKRIILNVTCFGLAWMPYVIMTFYAQFGNDIENYINPFTTSVPSIIAKISSIYNPILYTLTSKNCKNYYKRLLCINKD